MFLKSISLHHFRNYLSQKVEFGRGINIFSGRNAQGKTNLLEAIYFLSTGRSFRTTRVTELIRHGSKALHINGLIERQGSVVNLSINYSENNKIAQINARRAARFQEIVGLLNVVIFAPDDIEIIKGPPLNRRRYLDIQIAQTNKNYIKKLYQYNQVVRQRNAVLRSRKLSTLDVWNDELVKHGVTIVLERKKTMRRLSPLARLAHRKIAEGKEELWIEYSSLVKGSEQAEMEESFRGLLRSRAEQEKKNGVTMVGPHRDEIIFTINGLDARSYASEGQRRSAVMALRLAQYEFVKSGGEEKPIVLIDDVTADLDPMRKRAFLPLLNEKGQIFAATASDEKVFENQAGARLFTIEKGAVVC